MAGYYTVKQGDHLSKIAHAFGFSDYHTIWNHPQNAQLKQDRNPNVLFPGDSLFVPDRQQRTEPRSTDNKHKFKAKKPTLKLKLKLEDAYDEPIAGAKCLLVLGGDTHDVTTDRAGRIEHILAPDVRDAYLVVQDDQTPLNGVPIIIKIGDLDPVEEESGQIARLNNLGYFAGDVNQRDPKAFESAVEEFQCDEGLTVDGICGPQTQARLKKVQGC